MQENIDAMSKEEIPISIDPFDMLQEHDLMIQRLIKAHNEAAQHVEQMAHNAEQMAASLNASANRVKKLEHLVETLVKTMT